MNNEVDKIHIEPHISGMLRERPFPDCHTSEHPRAVGLRAGRDIEAAGGHSES